MFVEGTRCPFGEGYCGHAPMYSWQPLDLDEFPPRAIAVLTGAKQVRRLSHAECNRRAGARLGNAMRKGKPRRSSTSSTTSRSRW